MCASRSIKFGSGRFFKFKLVGVGYRVWLSGSRLLFDFGRSNFYLYLLPPGLRAIASKNALLLAAPPHLLDLLSTVVGQLRSIRKVDRYGGKGLILSGSPPILKKKDGKS